jgi:hypothetical protein
MLFLSNLSSYQIQQAIDPATGGANEISGDDNLLDDGDLRRRAEGYRFFTVCEDSFDIFGVYRERVFKLSMRSSPRYIECECWQHQSQARLLCKHIARVLELLGFYTPPAQSVKADQLDRLYQSAGRAISQADKLLARLEVEDNSNA